VNSNIKVSTTSNHWFLLLASFRFCATQHLQFTTRVFGHSAITPFLGGNSGSAYEAGGSGLPYYCTPPVCVPDVIGALAVWRLQKKKMSCTCVWAQVELDKSTWQVALVKLTCHIRLRPLFKSLDKWQLVKSSCRVNLHGDPPKITPASCPKNPPRGVLRGGSGHGHGHKKGQNQSLFNVFAQKDSGEHVVFGIILQCSPPREVTLRLGSVAAAILRNNLRTVREVRHVCYCELCEPSGAVAFYQWLNTLLDIFYKKLLDLNGSVYSENLQRKGGCCITIMIPRTHTHTQTSTHVFVHNRVGGKEDDVPEVPPELDIIEDLSELNPGYVYKHIKS